MKNHFTPKSSRNINQPSKNKNLVKHGLAVEATMKKLAHHFNQNPDLWGLAGLIHDADWEQTQTNHKLHGKKTVQWLKQAGETNNQLLQAVLSHNFERNKENQPKTTMDWALYTCDELTGLIIATALVMPDKKLASVTLDSVLKKIPF